MTSCTESYIVEYLGSDAMTAYIIPFQFCEGDDLEVLFRSNSGAELVASKYVVSAKSTKPRTILFQESTNGLTIIIRRKLIESISNEEKAQSSLNAHASPASVSAVQLIALQPTIGKANNTPASTLNNKPFSIVRSQQDQEENGWSVFDFFSSYEKRQLSREFSNRAAAECSIEVNKALRSGQLIRMPAGQLLTEAPIIVGDGVRFLGAGPGISKIKKPAGSTAHLMDLIGTTIKRNIHISGFDMDVNRCDAGIVMEYVEDSLFENLRIFNHPYWGIQMGVQNGSDQTIRNKRNTLRNLYLSNTSLTYEHLLFFNCEDILVDGFHADIGFNANGIGLYQRVSNFKVRNFHIQNMKVALYYSLSCKNITISDGVIENTTAGIQGANLSDNGNFGSKYAEDLCITNVQFVGNKDCGLSLGALHRFLVDRCLFSENLQAGIVFTDGGIGVAGNPALERIADAGVISNTTFRSNNAGNIPSINAPGIHFSGAGGQMNLDLVNNTFLDDRGVGKEKQVYPVSFVNGKFTGINMSGGSAKSYGSASTFGVVNAKIEAKISGVNNVTENLPEGVIHVE